MDYAGTRGELDNAAPAGLQSFGTDKVVSFAIGMEEEDLMVSYFEEGRCRKAAIGWRPARLAVVGGAWTLQRGYFLSGSRVRSMTFEQHSNVDAIWDSPTMSRTSTRTLDLDILHGGGCDPGFYPTSACMTASIYPNPEKRRWRCPAFQALTGPVGEINKPLIWLTNSQPNFGDECRVGWTEIAPAQPAS